MVTENSTAPFSVIAPQRELQNGLKVYKLFSSQPLWSGTLQEIFQNLTVLEDRWSSFPSYLGFNRILCKVHQDESGFMLSLS